MAVSKAQIESAVSKLPSSSQEDMREVLLAFFDQHELQNNATGISWLSTPNNQQQAQTPPPPIASAQVNGANGQYTIQITNPALPSNAALYHEVSYSTVKNFSQNVTTLPVSTSTHITVPNPGQQLFFRYRSTLNRQTWNTHTLASQSAVDAGLQSSAATDNSVVFNQTNRATVDSVAVAGAANVRIFGAAGGPYTNWIGQKGASESVRPSATIIGVPFNSTKTVAYNPATKDYVIADELPQVLPDNLVPVGQVSVVGGGALRLPTIVPVITAGSIIGYNVTDGGNGITGDLILSLASVGGGSGATFGAQTIQNGVLISVAPGNPGASYSGGTTVVAAGGVSVGGAGGGGTTGANPGRLIPQISGVAA